MRRSLSVLICVVAVGVWTASAAALGEGHECKGCAKVKKAGQGFCDHCGAGLFRGLKLTSRKIFDALAGSASAFEKAKTSKCPECRHAAKTGGVCEHCHTFVTGGKVYHNRLAYTLARGKPLDPEAAKHCPGCAKAARNGGFCSSCKVGVVANRTYRTRALYDAAVRAYETIKAAVKDTTKCEQCALARLKDGTCPHCKVTFKNGKPI